MGAGVFLLVAFALPHARLHAPRATTVDLTISTFMRGPEQFGREPANVQWSADADTVRQIRGRPILFTQPQRRLTRTFRCHVAFRPSPSVPAALVATRICRASGLMTRGAKWGWCACSIW